MGDLLSLSASAGRFADTRGFDRGPASGGNGSLLDDPVETIGVFHLFIFFETIHGFEDITE